MKTPSRSPKMRRQQPRVKEMKAEKAKYEEMDAVKMEEAKYEEMDAEETEAKYEEAEAKYEETDSQEEREWGRGGHVNG